MKTNKTLGMTLREFITLNNLSPETENLEWFDPDKTILMANYGNIYTFQHIETGVLCAVDDSTPYSRLLTEDELNETKET